MSKERALIWQINLKSFESKPIGIRVPTKYGVYRKNIYIWFMDQILLEVIIGTPKKMCDQKPNVFQGRLLLGLKKLTHLVIFEHVDVA